MNTCRKGPVDVTSPSAPPCHPAGGAGPCATCSGGVIEMEVVRLEPGGLAMARAPAGVAEISIALVAAQAGDTVLVHAGEAITVVQ